MSNSVGGYDIVSLINSVWMPVLLALLCAGYGVYLAITKDPKAVRRKNDREAVLKESAVYVKNAMWLMFFMALGCVIMACIIFFTGNDMAATIQSISWFIFFAILWKRNEDKNGAL